MRQHVQLAARAGQAGLALIDPGIGTGGAETVCRPAVEGRMREHGLQQGLACGRLAESGVRSGIGHASFLDQTRLRVTTPVCADRVDTASQLW